LNSNRSATRHLDFAVVITTRQRTLLMNQLRRQSPSGSRCPMAVYAGPNDEARTCRLHRISPEANGHDSTPYTERISPSPLGNWGFFSKRWTRSLARSLDLQYKRLKLNSRS